MNDIIVTEELDLVKTVRDLDSIQLMRTHDIISSAVRKLLMSDARYLSNATAKKPYYQRGRNGKPNRY